MDPVNGQDIHRVLARWRAAERARDAAAPGSIEWLRADEEARATREAYRSLTGRNSGPERDGTNVPGLDLSSFA